MPRVSNGDLLDSEKAKHTPDMSQLWEDNQELTERDAAKEAGNSRLRRLCQAVNINHGRYTD